MATTAVSAFVPDIAYRVDGCPDPTIERAVLDACIEFCELTGVLKRTLDPDVVGAGTTEYELSLPSTEQLTSIISIACGSSVLLPVAEAHADYDMLFGASQGAPRAFIETSPGVIRFYPTPSDNYTVVARVCVKPKRTATLVDSVLFSDWKEAIIDGALSRLYAMPERWADGSRAAFHLKRFFSFASDARIEAAKGNTRAQRRVYGPSFV